jgi:hypothetical protein
VVSPVIFSDWMCVCFLATLLLVACSCHLIPFYFIGLILICLDKSAYHEALYYHLYFRFNYAPEHPVLKHPFLYSNKSTNQIHQSRSLIACRLNTARHVSGILMPIVRGLSTAVTACGLPLGRGDSSAVGRGRAGRPEHDQQHCYHHVPTVNQRRLLQLISSWWWAWGCPKHVELYLSDRK